jgi:hypothetical protein
MEERPLTLSEARKWLEEARRQRGNAREALASLSPSEKMPRGITVRLGPLTLETEKRRCWRKLSAEKDAAEKTYRALRGEFFDILNGAAAESFAAGKTAAAALSALRDPFAAAQRKRDEDESEMQKILSYRPPQCAAEWCKTAAIKK